MKKSILLDLLIKQLNHHLVMSSEYKIGHIDVKRIKLEDNHEKITSFDRTCRNSVVDYYKNKCMEFYRKQLDVKSVRAYNTYTNTGKIVQKYF